MSLKWPIAWKQSFKILGWWQFVLCLALVGVLLVLAVTVWEGNNGLITAVRIVEIIVPLFAGMQAAYAFSPEDERPLELMLAAPRPILWTLAERVGIVLVAYLTIWLVGSSLTLLLASETNLSQLIVRGLPPLIWFIGVGLYLTLVTRQGMFGALMVLVIWGTSLVSSGGLPQKYLLFAPILPYLQRGAFNISDDLYTLNRITLTLTGFLLVGLAARLTRDGERLLGIKSKRVGVRKWRIRRSPLVGLPPISEET